MLTSVSLVLALTSPLMVPVTVPATVSPAGPSTAPAPIAAHHLYQREGAPGERLGAAVAAAGDVDGDGHGDVAVGAPHAGSEQQGRVVVFSGLDGSVLLVLAGDDPYDRLGTSVAAAGDVDGDGRADLVVGAPGGTPPEGAALVVSGASGTVLMTLVGDAPGDRFGHAVCGIGDQDGDGKPDLAIGAPQRDAPGGGPNAGCVYLVSGHDGAPIASVAGSTFDFQGSALAALGDLDGDGRCEIAVGVPFSDAGAFNGGSVLVLRGGDGALLFARHGTGIGDQLGASVSAAGDVDGDGTPDVAVGAPGSDAGGIDAGAALVFSGRPRVAAPLLVVPGLEVGTYQSAVCGVGDVDGDGRADLAVGSASAGAEAGRVRIVSGASGAELAAFAGRHVNDWYGAAVCALGDANGDGHADLAVGAPGHDDHPTHVGRVQVLSTVALPPGAALRARTPSSRPRY